MVAQVIMTSMVGQVTRSMVAQVIMTSMVAQITRSMVAQVIMTSMVAQVTRSMVGQVTMSMVGQVIMTSMVAQVTRSLVAQVLMMGSKTSEGFCQIQVKGFVGGGLLIRCIFKDQYKQHTKYFCKGDKSRCPFQRHGKSQDDRYKEFNVKEEGSYVVFIKQLSLSDAGNYGCAVDSTHLDIDTYIPVSITIKQDDCCKGPLTRTAAVGQRVDISCRHPKESSDNKKYFCKQGAVFTCSSPSEASRQYRWRFLEPDDDDDRLAFTVRISNVTGKDLGVYWCGVRTGENTGSVALLTEVHLKDRDTEEHTGPLPPSSSSSGLPLTIGVCLPLAVLLAIAVFILIKHRHRQASKHAASYCNPASKSCDPASKSCDPASKSCDPASKTPPDKRHSPGQALACADGDYEEIRDIARPPQRLKPHGVTSAGDPTDLIDPADLCTDFSAYATVRFVQNPTEQPANGSSSAELGREDQDCEYAAVKYV
ncbi:hypothetical protein ACEWY4_017282 [Coilia grayii]|uniref:Ig-like domain-containing protein n=1 Tax=Coilia grayii TaxID=363190 RepID=A0ABD1JJR0_9TELE